MNDVTRKVVCQVLEEKCWCAKTCLVFDPNVPSANHCAQTAILLQRKFGGEILRTRVRGDQVHFYNRIDEKRVDLTADQFTAHAADTWSVEYDDEVVTVEDAMAFTDRYQVENLLQAFEVAAPYLGLK